jgi:hypothetical protein
MLADHFGPERIAIGEAKRITGDVVIRFSGQGQAKFRVQHACDRDGEPDDLSWCDVSAISNRDIEQKRAIDKDGAVRGPLVGFVNGTHEAVYRHHKAAWLRVVTDDEGDKELLRRCEAYSLTLRPASP